MEEEKYNLGDSDGMNFKKGRFAAWFENFWYHYKWHTIAIFFIIIVVTICTVQMCSKEEYDIHIIYAGSYDVRGQDSENDISAYETMQKSLNEAVGDFDGNGKITSSLVNDLLLPLIGFLCGSRDMTALNVLVRPEITENGEVIQEAITLGFGTFLGTVVDFLLIALVIFAIVKISNKAHKLMEKKKAEEETVEEEAKPSTEELLTQILEELKKR